MSVLLLGIGDFGASRTPGDVVKTLALGSCVGVVILDPKTRTVGMVHVALPESRISPERAAVKPGYFADTGIPSLLQCMAKLGCDPTGKGMIVKIAGGAKVVDPHNTFNIGKRNVLAVKKVLWQYGMGPVAEDVGDTISRTLTVDVDRGRVIISSPARPDWEI